MQHYIKLSFCFFFSSFLFVTLAALQCGYTPKWDTDMQCTPQSEIAIIFVECVWSSCRTGCIRKGGSRESRLNFHSVLLAAVPDCALSRRSRFNWVPVWTLDLDLGMDSGIPKSSQQEVTRKPAGTSCLWVSLPSDLLLHHPEMWMWDQVGTLNLLRVCQPWWPGWGRSPCEWQAERRWGVCAWLYLSETAGACAVGGCPGSSCRTTRSRRSSSRCASSCCKQESKKRAVSQCSQRRQNQQQKVRRQKVEPMHNEQQ